MHFCDAMTKLYPEHAEWLANAKKVHLDYVEAHRAQIKATIVLEQARRAAKNLAESEDVPHDPGASHQLWYVAGLDHEVCLWSGGPQRVSMAITSETAREFFLSEREAKIHALRCKLKDAERAAADAKRAADELAKQLYKETNNGSDAGE